MSRYQVNILLRGLKSTPTPKRNIIQLKSDIYNYTRKLRLTEFFHNAPENNNLQNLFKTKSHFIPSRNRDRDLDHQIDILNNLDLEGMDISSKEQSELSKLINDKTIIIKPADKGGAEVVLSTEHYKTIIMQHLDDASTYKKFDLNIDMKIHKNLKKLLHKYNKCFTESEQKFLNERSFETSNFYGLPKIHKSKVIEAAMHSQNTEVVEVREPHDLKLRPIVRGPICPTRRRIYFLDTLLKPYLKHVKSYIRDNVDFLNKCPREVDPDTEIVTFDVTRLYTSIPHEYGLKDLGHFLTTFKEEMNPRFNNQFILDAADFILKNNSLTFDSMFLLQLTGTAMGTVFAPTYANLTMAYHKIQVYFVSKSTYGLVVSKFFEENWFQFSDDCEILLNTKLIKPNDLLTILNQIDANLQFTMK